MLSVTVDDMRGWGGVGGASAARLNFSLLLVAAVVAAGRLHVSQEGCHTALDDIRETFSKPTELNSYRQNSTESRPEKKLTEQTINQKNLFPKSKTCFSSPDFL